MDSTVRIIKQAKKFFADAKGSHDWEHTWRVYNLCLHLAKKERADLEIVKAAALLHDIGRKYQDQSRGRICHAVKGAELAEKLLTKLSWPAEKIQQVVHCVKTHRFRGNNIPLTIEAKILFDADKLDSIGAVGIGRAFLFAGEIGAKLHDKKVDLKKSKTYSTEDTAYREYLVKLRKIKGLMLTKEGKRLAQERHRFMVEFFKRLNREVDGQL